MKVLVLAHRLPYPPHKGEKIRALNILRYVSKRHEVHLASLLDDAADMQYLAQLENLVRTVVVHRIHRRVQMLRMLLAFAGGDSMTSRYFYAEALQRRVDALIEREGIEAVFCFSSAMAEYVLRSRQAERLRLVPKVMDLIDVDSAKWQEYAERSPFWTAWLYRREARKVAESERRIGSEFDRVLVVSEPEKLYAPIASERVCAMPNGVDLQYFSPNAYCEADRQARTLVFTGVMNYHPNVDGICWFVDRVLPMIRAAVDNVNLYIVGNRPGRRVRRLARHAGVVVTGFVPDVREYIGRATVSIAPLRIARGIQNKVLEAMAMGRPTVATPQAFEGIDAEPGKEIAIAADEGEFAEKVIELLRNPTRADDMGKCARQRVERRYSWDRNLRLLDELFPISTCDDMSARDAGWPSQRPEAAMPRIP